MAGQFQIDVNTILNTKDVPKQLSALNAQLTRSTSTKIQIPVTVNTKTGLKALKNFVKEVNTYKDKFGNTLKEVKIIDPKTNNVFKDTINRVTEVSEGLKTLTTETNKWVNSKGEINTWTTTVNNAGQTVTTRVKETTTAMGELVKETSTWGRNAQGQFQQLGNATRTVSNIVKEMTTTTSTVSGTINDLGKSYKGLITTTEKVGTNGEYLRTVVSEYINETGQAVVKTEQFNKANIQVATTQRVVTDDINKTSQSIHNLGNSSQQSASKVEGLGNMLSRAFTRLANYYIASIPIQMFRKAVSGTIETVKNFDAAITEMGKVSEYSGQQLKNYTKDLAELGTEVARTRTEMTEAATGWLKAGYSEEDAALLAKFSALLQNTADEEISAADATSVLVSQLKAYHMETEEAIKVTDIINKVSANQAVSSYDISQGLTMASAAMATFGNNIEETTALLTAGTTIFQGRSKQVARGLNMIATRVAKNGEELKKYGVDINDANGQLRSTYEILVDLAPKWNAMTKAQQVALGNTLAGTNQYKILAAIMSQMDVAVEAYDQALDASGETMKQNAVYMESITAKTTALKAEFEKLALGDGGLQSIAKGFIDIGTSILKFINAIGGLTPLLIALSGIILTIKFDVISTSVVGLVKNIKKLIVNLPTMINLFREGRASGMNYGDALQYAGVSASVAQLAIGALTIVLTASVMAWGLVKTAAAEAQAQLEQSTEEYENYTNTLVNTLDKIKNEKTTKQELTEINKQLNKSYDEEKAALEDINDLRKENLHLLYQEAKDKAEKYIAENTIEYGNAKKRIEDTVGYDSLYGAIDTVRNTVLGWYAPYYDEALDEIKEIVNSQNAADAIETITNRLIELKKAKEENGQLTIEEMTRQIRLEEVLKTLNAQYEKDIKVYNAYNDAVKTTTQSEQEFINEITGNKIPQEIKKELEDLGKGGNVDLTIRPVIDVKELEKAGWEDVGEGIATVFSSTFSNKLGDTAINFTPIMVDPRTGKFIDVMSPERFEEYCQNVVDGVHRDYLNLQIGAEFHGEDAVVQAEAAAERIHEIHEKLYSSSNLTQEQIQDLINTYNISEEEIYNYIDANEDLDLTYEEAVQAIASENQALEEIDESIKSFAETLGITATELSYLKEKFSDVELYSFLGQLAETKQELSDTSTIVDNLQTALENASNALEEYNEKGYLTLDTFQGLMGISAQYLAALVNEEGQLEINQTTLGNLVEQLKIAKIQELAQAAAMEIAANHTQGAAIASSNAVQPVASIGNTIAEVGNKAATAAGQVAGFGQTVSAFSGISFSKMTTEDKKILNYYKDIAKELANIEVNTTKAGNAGASAGKKGAGGAKQAKDATKELNSELEKTKSNYDKVITFITGRIDKKIKAIQKEKDSALDAIEAEIKAREKQKDKALDNIEAQIKALEKEKKAREKYWDEQIDALKKANDERKDALELQEKLDALERAKNTKVKVYKEGQGFVYDVDQTAVAEAQKALDEYLSEKAYEDELERLNALKDAESENYAQRIDALNEYKDKVQASYEKQIEALQAHKEALEKEYDAQIEYYQNFKDQFEEMVKAYEDKQTELLATQLTGINFENDNWMTRLDNLAKFVNEYNRLQGQLENGSTDNANTAQLSGGGGLPKGTPNTTTNTTPTINGNNLTPAQREQLSRQGNKVVVDTGNAEYRARVLHIKTGHADGVSSVKDDEIAVVGENPNKEIVVGSKLNNGQLMSLNKGDGVVNASSSNTLAGMLNQLGKFGSSGFGSGNGTLNSNINNDSLVINGVTVQGANIKDPQTFVNGLLNLKAEALQRAYRHR